MNQPRDLDAASHPDADATGRASAAITRRAMLKAGGAATPVLLTLASGPVAAGGSYNCVVASSFVSATTFKSRNGGSTTVNCTKNTWTCDAWHTNALSSSYDALLNQTLPACLGYAPSGYTTITCRTVMQQSVDRTTQTGVCQHFIALINNCDKGWTNSGFNKAYLQGAWKDFCMGTFPASNPAGSKWDAATTINWLRVMLGYTW